VSWLAREAVFTVHTYATTAHYEPRLVHESSAPRRQPLRSTAYATNQRPNVAQVRPDIDPRPRGQPNLATGGSAGPGELVGDRPELVVGGTALRRVAAVLHETAIELNAGRAVPIGVRRAVRALADELRTTLDPRSNPATDPSSRC
jgi:hypothetical protein